MRPNLTIPWDAASQDPFEKLRDAHKTCWQRLTEYRDQAVTVQAAAKPSEILETNVLAEFREPVMSALQDLAEAHKDFFEQLLPREDRRDLDIYIQELSQVVGQIHHFVEREFRFVPPAKFSLEAVLNAALLSQDLRTVVILSEELKASPHVGEMSEVTMRAEEGGGELLDELREQLESSMSGGSRIRLRLASETLGAAELGEVNGKDD